VPQPALLAHDLVRNLGGRRILDGVSLTASPGHRIGLIGENGVGKSTLLRLLAGVDEPDGGFVVRPPELGFLHQEMPYDPASTVSDVVDDALRDARAAVAELDELSAHLDGPDALQRYGELLGWAQDHDVWDADRRAGLVLAGLGLGGTALHRALGTLSGGQRSRLGLAALLLRRPAALLLDEPTNHLDDGAAAFLEEQLRGLPGVVVAASHDRAFLDAVCTDVIDLDPAVNGPTRYGGGYSDYLAEKHAERERWERRFAEEQEELGELRHSVGVTAHRVAPGRPKRDNEKMAYGYKGERVQHQIARRVRNATRRLDELTRDQVRRPPEPLRFRVENLAAPGGTAPLLALRDVRVPGRLTLDRLDVSATERLLVTGPNGSGKSTLLAVLAGRLGITDGTLHRRRGLRAGLLAQDTVFPRPDRTGRLRRGARAGARRTGAPGVAGPGGAP
jgi:macrolide transport system ATP-binding/permease protein